MQAVAIFGVGLIGGSFASALKKRGFTGRILGVGSPETLRRARDLGVIDEEASLESAAAQADLLYLAQPIRAILDTLPRLAAVARPDALITDAGSTKARIVAIAEAAHARCQFLGGHPLAGKETRGVENADADLFEGRPYVVTPRTPRDLETPQARDLLDWIKRIGARPVTLDADEHDRMLAYSSHLPQLISTALSALLESGPEGMERVAGPALLDATRLALSPYEIWSDILATNRPAIEAALESFSMRLHQLRQGLGAGDLRGEFAAGADFAARLRKAEL
jgi:prephenate dehydrogenase